MKNINFLLSIAFFLLLYSCQKNNAEQVVLEKEDLLEILDQNGIDESIVEVPESFQASISKEEFETITNEIENIAVSLNGYAIMKPHNNYTKLFGEMEREVLDKYQDSLYSSEKAAMAKSYLDYSFKELPAKLKKNFPDGKGWTVTDLPGNPKLRPIQWYRWNYENFEKHSELFDPADLLEMKVYLGQLEAQLGENGSLRK